MRTRGGQWRMAVISAAALCALLLAIAAAPAQSGNPLRSATIAKPVQAVEPAIDGSPIRSATIRSRRFTPFDVWGNDVATNFPQGPNPLRQVRVTEDEPTAARTPEQAIREAEWADVGPQGRHLQAPSNPWHDTLSHGWFVHSDPNDPHRSIGWGEPLVGTSWRNRPWYFGAFIGPIFNGDLIAGHVEQNNTALGGARLGLDFDHYWGIEARFGYANPHISEPDGTPLGVSRNYLADVELLYYPWGDSRWRPYFTVGLGAATFRFTDDQDHVIHESLLSVPLGVGLKYFYSPWFTIRLELMENLAFGSQTLDNQANFSFLAGVEYRFGGRRPSYFPWHGNTAGW